MNTKKYFLSFSLIALFFFSSCSVTVQNESFENKVATRAALVFTATALAESLSSPTETPQPTSIAASQQVSSPTPGATATLPSEDPLASLGQPSWKDDLSTGRNWNLDSGAVSYGGTIFSHKDGKLHAKSSTTSEGYIWYLTYLKLKNAYLEAKFDLEACSGKDSYGLVFRAEDYTDGYAYYFSASCDGHYSLRRWDNTGSILILDNIKHDAINAGSDKSNTLGIWSKESRFRLYINGQFLEELNDASLPDEGHFGLFINARETPGFSFGMDEIAYWNIN